MKVRVSVLALLMAVLPALVFGYSGFGGGKGLFRVQNAMVEDEAGLIVSLHTLIRNTDFPPGEGPNNRGWVADLFAPELSYAPVATKYVGLELFGSWGGAFQYPESRITNGFVWGFHDLKAGGKVSVPILPVLKVGGTASYTFIKRETKATWQVLDPAGVSMADKIAWAALATIQLQDVLPSAPNFLFSYGRFVNKGAPELSETRLGGGVELQGKGFALFVEALAQHPDRTDVAAFDTKWGHVHLTPGVTFGSATSSFFKLGYTFSFGGDSTGVKQPNELIIGLGFATPFGTHVKPEYGTITGTVTDEKTGAAITANVGFPKNDRMAPFTTDATGVFEVKKVRTGVTVVEVGARGYQSQSVPLDITKGDVTTHDFKLRSLVAYGVVAGTVIDATTQKPLNARIEFPKSGVAAVNSDQAGGAFRVNNVPTAVYTVTAALEGYFTGSQSVTVEDGKVANVAFSLTPSTMTTMLTGKVSDKKTGDPLLATVSFPGSSVGSVMTDAATGVYKTQIPVGSYAMQAEAEGYVKQTAAIVIEKDKPQVKDFQLLKVGMSITLRGIYFDFDKSTIKPESRPALEDAAKMLKENPTINVEIQGHTDSKGSDAYNLSLSDRRSAAVVTYLVTILGVDASRLTSRGYGESMPIATNDTDAGRALNRRVEFKVIGEK